MSKQSDEWPLGYWASILLGAFFVFFGAEQIVTGKPVYYKSTEVPAWAGFITFPFGLWVMFVSIRGLWRGRGKPPEPPKTAAEIDEEAARAKARLDAMYLREYGVPPETPKKDE